MGAVEGHRGRTGDPVSGNHDEMLEAAIWIGVALSGVVLLGIFEYLRSNSFIKAHGEGIKAGLPTAFVILLLVIAASVAALFFFLFFLAAFWINGLIVIGIIFVFLVVRLRKERSLGALVAQPRLGAGERGTAPSLYLRAATLAVEAAGAALLMVMLVPFAAGGFIFFWCLRLLLDTMGIVNFVSAGLLVLGAIFLAYYLWSARRRQPPPP